MKKSVIHEDDVRRNNIVIILVMSVCFGISSSLSFSLLPSFVKNYLNCDSKNFGDMSGIVLAGSFVIRSLYTIFMDIIAKYKMVFKIGIALSIIGKSLVVLSFSIFMIFVAKVIDRIAKGIRIASINSVILKNTQCSNKNTAFARYETCYALGVLIGLFIVKMLWNNQWPEAIKYRVIFACAIPFLLITYYMIGKLVIDTHRCSASIAGQNRIEYKLIFQNIKLLPKSYWMYIIFILSIMMSYYDIGFIQYRACEIDLKQDVMAMCYVIYHVSILIASIMSVHLYKILSTYKLFVIGLILIIFANVFGIFASGKLSILMVYILGGLHYGITRGITYSSISKYTSNTEINTAFAVFYILEAVALFACNILAGRMEPVATLLGLPQTTGPFVLGATVSAISLLILYAQQLRLNMY